jgi:hypothetical protein
MRYSLRAPLVVILVLGCGRDVVFVDPPPAGSHTDSTGSDTTGSDTTGTDTTTARRVTLSVTVTIDPADTALATRLGMPGGRLSGAEVTATRFNGLQVPQLGTTDSLGRVSFPGLIEGFWTLIVIRPLSAAERDLLDSANLDVTGFGGGYQDVVDSARALITFATKAGRQGTLVISEAYLPYPTVGSATGSEYLLGQYIEIHNNSFSTVYLDGKVLARSLPFVSDGSFSCSESARWREDSAGIWTRFFVAFPGTGTSHPLAPGGSAIIAIDAINHTTIHPGLRDLSDANFEIIGTNDVDNPAVPNMVNRPPYSPRVDPVGHGTWWVNEISIFLAEPFNPDSLPRDFLPVQSPDYVRVPREKILDVLTSGKTPGTTTGTPYCANFVHPSFDGAFATLIDGSVTQSLTRIPLGVGGILQRTKISGADFNLATPTPQQVH